VVRGISHTFTRIRQEVSLSEVFIKVEVYATDFNENNEYVSNIDANGHVLSNYCSPQVDQGGFFHTCIRDRNVTSFIDYTKDDGTLTVTVQATRSVDAYPYQGFLLYVKFSISGLIRPTSEPTGQPSHQPTTHPSRQPSSQPSIQPISVPSSQPSSVPSRIPTQQPSSQPSRRPSAPPSRQPSSQPTVTPSSSQPTSGNGLGHI
jgi:hypothetical protein